MMYIYRLPNKELYFRKSSTGKYALYLKEGGQQFKMRSFRGGLTHISRNLHGFRRFTATVKLLLIGFWLEEGR